MLVRERADCVTQSRMEMGSSASPAIPGPHHQALLEQQLVLWQGYAGTYRSHSSFRQRLPKPGLFRRTSASAASCSLPGWSMLDRERGAYDMDTTGMEGRAANMKLNTRY